MALQCFVDAFNIGTGAAASTVVRTGYGFQPKACLYWWSGRTESAATFARKTLLPGLGMAVSPTSRAAISGMSQDAVATMVCAARHTNAACVECLTTAKALEGSADLQSFDANGQTLVITDQFVTSLRVHCLAIGGSDLTNVELVQFQVPGSGLMGPQNVTVSFQPTALLLMSAILPAAPPTIDTTGLWLSLGLVTSSAAQASIACMDANGGVGGTSENRRYGRSGECLDFVWGGALVAQRAVFVDFQSTGFQLNWVENATGAAPVWALALRGGSAAVGSFVTTTSATTITESGLGFAPTGLFFLSAEQPESVVDTTSTNCAMAFGAATSPTNRACQSVFANDASNSSVCGSSVREDACLQMLNSATVSAGIVDLQSMDSDGFTAVMDVADVTTQKYVTYLALGSTPGAPAVVPLPRARVLPQAVMRAAYR
jgi:hypothetical protein